MDQTKRVILGAVLVWVLLGLAWNLVGFTNFVVQTTHDGRAIIAAHNRTPSIPELEARLRVQNVFGYTANPMAKLRCEKTPMPWDFTCSFEPTPLTSTTRVKFGIRVDNNGTIFEYSRLAPADAALPAPEKPFAR